MNNRPHAICGYPGPFQDGTCEHIPVRIGDVKTAMDAAVLFSIGIGSCVVVALYDAGTRTGGMAHVMLPQPPRRQVSDAIGRYASTAIPQLLSAMSGQGARPGALRARIAGGASMFRDLLDGEGLRLGRRNVEAVRSALQLAQVPIEGEDVFGGHGRSVYLRTTDGALLVTSVNRADVRL
jgi:chemotaxis protein CheD